MWEETLPSHDNPSRGIKPLFLGLSRKVPGPELASRVPARDGPGGGVAAAARRVVDRDVLGAKDAARGGVGRGRGLAALVGEGAADGEVHQQEVGLGDGLLPGAGLDLAGQDLVVLHAVDEPGHLLPARAARAVHLERVRVEVGRARLARAGRLAAADALVLVAGAAGGGAAVQRGVDLVFAVDVLQDVELADHGPVSAMKVSSGRKGVVREREVCNLRVDAAECRSKCPEGRPVTQGLSDLGYAQASLDAHCTGVSDCCAGTIWGSRKGKGERELALTLAPGGREEVLALRLDAGRGPGLAVLDGRDLDVALAVELDVGRVFGVGLDLARAEVGGAARVAGARGEDPVLRLGQAARRALKVVAPGQREPVDGRDRRPDRRGGRGGEEGEEADAVGHGEFGKTGQDTEVMSR